MNQKRKPNKVTCEGGITLIALIVIIVILIILSAVTIKGLTGSNGLIETTGVAAEDYKIKGYGEQIDQNVRGTILEHATMGEEASLEDLADGLEEETEWIRSAIVCNDETIRKWRHNSFDA